MRMKIRVDSVEYKCWQGIVRVNEESADRVRYGLASYRWFEPRSFMFGDPDELPDADEVHNGLGK